MEQHLPLSVGTNVTLTMEGLRVSGCVVAARADERWVLFDRSAFALVPEDHVLALRRDAAEVRVVLHAEGDTFAGSVKVA